MFKFPTLPTIILLTVLTIVSGVVHGWTSGRWGPPQQMTAAAELLEQFPEQFGPWQMKLSEELQDNVISMLQCAGYLNRIYVNQDTGEQVTMAVILGPSGPISVHTPEVCYSTREWSIVQKRESIEIITADGSPAKLWALTLASNDELSGGMLRSWYGWSDGGAWASPRDPRFTYATSPYLYKIQLAGLVAPDDDSPESDPCRQFLKDAIPELNKAILKP